MSEIWKCNSCGYNQDDYNHSLEKFNKCPMCGLRFTMISQSLSLDPQDILKQMFDKGGK